MKKILILCLLIFTILQSFSQRKTSYKSTSYSIGAELLFPAGIFHDIGYSFGFGGSAQVEYKPDQSIGITGYGGIINFQRRKEFGPGSYTVLPLMVGAKYYITTQLYAHGQFGAGIGISQGSVTSFAVSPSLGYFLSKNIDIEGKYLGLSNSTGSLNSLGFRIAYNF
jgi:hypothetical protein